MATNCSYDAEKKTLIIYSVEKECKAELIFEGSANIRQISEFLNNNGKTIRFGGENITSIVGQNSALVRLSCATTIILPSTLIELGQNVFKGMTCLETINLGDTKIEDIGESCFEGCAALNDCFNKFNGDEEILPSTLKIIGDKCFNGCISLGIVDPKRANTSKTLHIPKSITTLGGEGGTFVGAKYKKMVFVDFYNTVLTRFDNNMFTDPIDVQFFPGVTFKSNLFIYNENEENPGSQKPERKDKWFANNLTGIIDEKNLYYKTIKKISNPDDKNKNECLTDSQFKFMLKYNVILSDSETPLADVIINQTNKKSEELKQELSTFKTMVFTGFVVVLTTSFVCNMLIIYKRK